MQSIRDFFKKPTASEIAEQEIEESQRQALSHASAANYHHYMAEFHRQNVIAMQQIATQHNKTNG